MNAHKIITALIVEDEPKSAEVLEYLLGVHCPEVVVKGIAGNVGLAIKEIALKKPELLFLDVELTDGSSFDILHNQPCPIHTIFTTAYDQYALKALKENAIDYLLKPVRPEDLMKAVKKVCDKTGTPAAVRRLSIPVTGGIILVVPDDIRYCRASGSYTKLYLAGQITAQVVSKKISDLGLWLPPCFFRVHHSCIVNLNHVVRYVQGRGGYIIMDDGEEIEVAARKKQDFLKLLRM